MKIMSIMGARPNFIKMSPLVREIEKRGIDHTLVHTGQHYDAEMSDIFIEELGLTNAEYLGIGSGTHGYQTGRMLIELERIMIRDMPDVVLVPGDTNTTLSGALAAVKLKIPIGHVEAGLRSFDRTMPEEINRVLTDHCSDHLFCPTSTAVENLRREGISEDRIFMVGDTMVEACLQNLEIAKKKSTVLKRYGIRGYFLATVHRAENVDDRSRLENIVEAFVSMDKTIVYPVHPRTLKRLKQHGLFDKLRKAENVLIIEPVGYLDSLMLISRAELVLTDSGGVQKEAFLLKTPCVTLRESTEWVETVDLGCNVLTGTDKEKIIRGVEMMLTKKLNNVENPFGDDKACERITNILEEKYDLDTL